MVKLRLTVLTIALFTVLGEARAQNPELVEQYINKYRELAISEQVRVGIPAAVTLAQGIHETGAGTSRLAKLGNNHFGIKCKRSWKGQTIKHTDDAPNECFRKYDYPLDSYKDHSDYLRNNPRYASLFKLSITDYAAWCIGLRRAGYATNPRYAQMLIKLIENYKLQEYTYAAMGNNSMGDSYVDNRENEIVPDNDPLVKPSSTSRVVTPVPVTTVPVVTKTVSNSGMKVSEQRTVPTKEVPAKDHPPYGKPIKVNGLRAVYGKEGQAPLEYAIRNSIRYKRFLELNEMNEKVLSQDMYLYLERKHFRGVRPMHMVKPGETMHAISQKEGIQLRYLREMNFMIPGEEPVPGIVLELQNKAKEKPRVYEAPKESIPIKSAPRSSGYVKTNKSPIPSNPRYIAPATANKQSAIKVSTLPPQTKVVVKESLVSKAKEKVTTSPPKTVASNAKDEASINALKKQFDGVIYDKRGKQQEVTTNPRYVPNASMKKETVVQTNTAPIKKVTPKPTVVEPPKIAPKTVKPVVAVVSQTTLRPAVEAVTPANPKPIVKPIITNTKRKRKEKKNKKEAPIVQQKQTNTEVKQEQKSELDKLKAQFDAVVYDSPKEEVKVKATQNQVANPTKEQTNVLEKVEEQQDTTKYYIVKEGDTAFSIAKKHKITMRQLMDWNDLDFGAIKTGMKLQVKK